MALLLPLWLSWLCYSFVMVAARLFMRRQVARVRVLAADAAGCGEAVLADAVAAASGEADMADAVAAASEAARAGAIEMMRRRPEIGRAHV